MTNINTNGIVSLDDFKAPWVKIRDKWGNLTTNQQSADVDSALANVYGVAFAGNPVTTETAKEADWLLFLLAPGGVNDWEGLALIPESFWNTISGKGIYLVMVKAHSEEQLVPMKKAAEILEVPESRIYHLALLRRIPCFLDYREKNPRKRRRVRVDLLRNHYSLVIQIQPK